MSSQGVNARTYSGFALNGSTSGVPNGFPIRNSSDFTRMLKNRSIYRQFTTDPAETTKNGEQSNEMRLNFEFGDVTCHPTVCQGPFPKDSISFTKPQCVAPPIASGCIKYTGDLKGAAIFDVIIYTTSSEDIVTFIPTDGWSLSMLGPTPIACTLPPTSFVSTYVLAFGPLMFYLPTFTVSNACGSSTVNLVFIYTLP